jgi:hypothetical protein
MAGPDLLTPPSHQMKAFHLFGIEDKVYFVIVPLDGGLSK